MTLELNEEEAAELQALLDAAISDLSPEIADTDNPNFRAMLRQRRDRLIAIRDRVAQLPKSQPSPLS